MPEPEILIVEDEFIIAELMRDMIEAGGHGACVHASTLADALKHAQHGRWKAAFLDIRINGELVFPVADELRRKGVPLAFCSGEFDGADVPKQWRDANRLHKPWQPHELEAVLKKLLSAGA